MLEVITESLALVLVGMLVVSSLESFLSSSLLVGADALLWCYNITFFGGSPTEKLPVYSQLSHKQAPSGIKKSVR